MTEEWRPVLGYEGIYEVSSHGRVRSLDRIDLAGRRWPGRVLKPKLTSRGYLIIHLSGKPITKTVSIQRLVLEAFVGPSGDEERARHLNGIGTDNRVENLLWGTPSDSASDRVRRGTSPKGSRNGQAKLSEEDVKEIKALLEKGTMLQKDIAYLYGVARPTISDINMGRRWAHVR